MRKVSPRDGKRHLMRPGALFQRTVLGGRQEARKSLPLLRAQKRDGSNKTESHIHLANKTESHKVRQEEEKSNKERPVKLL